MAAITAAPAGDVLDRSDLESMSKLAYGPVKGLKSVSADF